MESMGNEDVAEYSNNDDLPPKEGLESLDLDTYPLIMDSRLFYSLMKR
jgi:hypothetical protein